VNALDLATFPIKLDPATALSDTREQPPPTRPQLFEDRKGKTYVRRFCACGDAELPLMLPNSRSRRYTTSFVDHGIIGTGSRLCRSGGGRIHVHACTKPPVWNLRGAGRDPCRPMADIRIVRRSGWGLGRKLILSLQPFIANCCTEKRAAP